LAAAAPVESGNGEFGDLEIWEFGDFGIWRLISAAKAQRRKGSRSDLLEI
jgi:hypothetical protein